MLANLQRCATAVYEPRPRSYLDRPLTDRLNIVRPFRSGFVSVVQGVELATVQMTSYSLFGDTG